MRFRLNQRFDYLLTNSINFIHLLAKTLLKITSIAIVIITGKITFCLQFKMITLMLLFYFTNRTTIK